MGQRWPEMARIGRYQDLQGLIQDDSRITQRFLKDAGRMKALPLSTNASAQQFAECAHACPPCRGKIQEIVRPHGGRSMPYGPHVGLGFGLIYFDLVFILFGIVRNG